MNQKRVAVYLFASVLVVGAMALPGWAQGGGQPEGRGPDIAPPHQESGPGGGGPGEAPRVDPPAGDPRDPAGPGPRFGGGFGRGGGRGPRAQGDQPPFGRNRDQGPLNREAQPPSGPGYRGGEKSETGTAGCPFCENCPYCQRVRERRGDGQFEFQSERLRPWRMMRRLWVWDPDLAQKWMAEMLKAGVPPRPAFRRDLKEAGPGGPVERERPAMERFRRFLRERQGVEARRPDLRERREIPAGERERVERDRGDRETGSPEREALRDERKPRPERFEGPAPEESLDGQIESLNQRLSALEEKLNDLVERIPRRQSAPRQEKEEGGSE
ncbi:MAG: hypothetical protein HPY51_20270 [Candidatus Omnitrophica bacterium]|nr:hypothetical protein [Candidatus Omnitrophota bacterium]